MGTRPLTGSEGVSVMTKLPTVRDSFSPTELELLEAVGDQVNDSEIQRRCDGGGVWGEIILLRARLQTRLVRSCALEFAHKALAERLGVDPEMDYIGE